MRLESDSRQSYENSGGRKAEIGPSQNIVLATNGNMYSDLYVQKTLKMLFKLEDIPKPDDAADALAIPYLASLGV
jgi:hypothetical protein